MGNITKITSFKMDPDLYLKLKLQAVREKRTVTAIINELIKNYLKEKIEQ